MNFFHSHKKAPALCAGACYLKYIKRKAAQSFDRMPPAIICIPDFHFNNANMKSFFYMRKFFIKSLSAKILLCNQWHNISDLIVKICKLKKIFIGALFLIPTLIKAQKIEKIFVNLYTDSLKKGTYNYINVDGLLSNGNYVPLDSTDIIFWASDGKFYGNTLLIDKDFQKEKVQLKVTLRNNPALTKEFTMFIKKKEDNEHLKTTEELLQDLQIEKTKGKKKKA